MGFNKELKYQRKSNKTIHKSPLIPKLGLIGPKCCMLENYLKTIIRFNMETLLQCILSNQLLSLKNYSLQGIFHKQKHVKS